MAIIVGGRSTHPDSFDGIFARDLISRKVIIGEAMHQALGAQKHKELREAVNEVRVAMLRRSSQRANRFQAGWKSRLVAHQEGGHGWGIKTHRGKFGA